jgi:phage/plasmid-like protein (TIGR03299 family)
MSHEIDFSTGTAAMAFKGATPWHGLGADMGTNQDMDDWRRRAGLNWEAKKANITFDAKITGENGRSSTFETNFEDRKVLYRDDTGSALGVVSPRFEIVQPADVMDFFRDLCSHNDFEMETAGALKGGRVIWALAKTGEEARISGTDAMKGYVLLSTSFDGSMATTAKHTSVRVVCNNTLQMSEADKAAICVRHNTVFMPDEAKRALGIGKSWETFTEQAQAMAEKGVTPEQSVEFFMQVYHGIVKGQILSPAEEKTAERTVRRLTEQLFHAPGAELRSAKGTVWGLLNAVTHDVDFARRSHNQDTRLTSAWYGQGAGIKAKAFDAALKLAA